MPDRPGSVPRRQPPHRQDGPWHFSLDRHFSICNEHVVAYSIERDTAIAKVVLSTHIEPRQKTALETLSRSTRVPVAEYIREAIDLVLARYAHLDE